MMREARRSRHRRDAWRFRQAAPGPCHPSGLVRSDRHGLRAAGESATTECEALDRDAYGRVIARCRAGGTDVGEVLVREGLAWAFRRYSLDYADVEDRAAAERLGIWQSPTMTPWDYRADRWGRAVAAATDGCPIKGNISATGERIYHTPWSPWYGRTQINEQSGERWFCDEAEAVQAGWRAARSR